MKATELIVGDYITVTPSGMLIQVAAVHKRKVAYHTCTDRLSWVREGLLRPIPVTQEILEKNGFVTFISSQYTLPNCSAGVILTTLKGMPNASGKWLVAIKKGYTDAKIIITYVHELQHAFGLCGINKEITL